MSAQRGGCSQGGVGVGVIARGMGGAMGGLSSMDRGVGGARGGVRGGVR